MGVIYMVSVRPEGALGHVYVGQARKFGVRKHSHLVDLHSGSHHNAALQRLFDQEGEDALSWQILDELPDDRLDTAEAYWIGKAIQELGREQVMNVTRTGRTPQPAIQAPSGSIPVEEGLEAVRALMAKGVAKTAAIRQVFKVKGGARYSVLARQV